MLYHTQVHFSSLELESSHVNLMKQAAVLEMPTRQGTVNDLKELLPIYRTWRWTISPPQIKRKAKSQDPQFYNLKEKNLSHNLNELGSELFSAKTPGNNAAADTVASWPSAEDLLK